MPTQSSTITEAVRAELEMLTPDDLCELLQVTKDWLYERVQAGSIPHVRLGRLLRFRASEIREWVSGEWQAPAVAVAPPEPPAPAVVRRGGRPRKH